MSMSRNPSSFHGRVRVAVRAFVDTAVAAVKLIARLAVRLRVTKLALPKAYSQLGHDVYSTDRFRQDFAALYDQVNDHLQRIEELRRAVPADPEQTQTRTHRMKGAVTKTARAWVTERRTSSALKELGRLSFDRFGEQAGPSDLTGEIADLTHRGESLDREIHELSKAHRHGLLTPLRLVSCALAAFLVLTAYTANRAIHRLTSDEPASSVAAPEITQLTVPSAAGMGPAATGPTGAPEPVNEKVGAVEAKNGATNPSGERSGAPDRKHSSVNRDSGVSGRDAKSATDRVSSPRPFDPNPRAAHERLRALREEMALLPTNLAFSVAGKLDEDTYEIVIYGQHAILRTHTFQFASTGRTWLPVIRDGSTTATTVNGFEREYPLFRQAMSSTGAFPLSTEDVSKMTRDLVVRIDTATHEVVAALLDAGHSGNDVETLAQNLGVIIDRSNQRELLEIQRQVTGANKYGYGPLQYAVQVGDVRLFDSLIQAGKARNAQAKHGIPLVHVAVLAHRHHARVLSEILTALRQAGADVNEPDAEKRTVMHIAAEDGAEDLLQVLSEQGASFNVLDKQGAVPLHLAVRGKSQALVAMLRLGADVNVRDSAGRSPLHVASELGKADLIQKLMDSGAMIDAVDAAGQTALHIACREGKSNVIGLLVSKGANRAAKDKSGQTPLRLFKGTDKPISLLGVTAVELGNEDAWAVVVADGTIIAGWTEGGFDAHLRAIAADGTQKWQMTVNGRFERGFAGSDGTVYVVLQGTSRSMLAVSSDGRERWRSSEVGSSKGIAERLGNTYHFAGENLVSWGSDGKEKWRIDFKPAFYGSQQLWIGPEGTIYAFGRDPGQTGVEHAGLVAVSASGKRKWTFVPWPYPNTAMTSPPAFGHDGTIYVGLGRGGGVSGSSMFALTPDGHKKWEYLAGVLGGLSPCVGPDGTLYVVSAGNLLAIAPNGSMSWKQACSANWGPTLGPDGSIYLASDLGRLTKITARGELLGSVDLREEGSMTTFAMGPKQVVYLVSSKGKAYLIDTKPW